MIIKKANISDIDSIINLYNQLREERDNNIPELKNILKSLINNNDSDLFIAIIDWKNIATFILNYRLDLWSIWKAIRLTAMIVDIEYRSKWIWTKITSWVEKYWKDNWYSIIELLSWLKREKAHNFYKKIWYKIIEYWFAKSLKKFDNKYL